MACKSGACSGGICLSHKLGNGEPCPGPEDERCQSGACGRSSYPSGDYVCCQRNFSSYIFDDYYCTETGEVGDECFPTRLVRAASALVMHALRKDSPLEHLVLVDTPRTARTQNEWCGRSSFPTGAYVCCPSNEPTVGSRLNFEQYCTATQNIRQKCHEEIPQICKSGICSKGICATY
jgi:hypothetical protein